MLFLTSVYSRNLRVPIDISTVFGLLRNRPSVKRFILDTKGPNEPVPKAINPLSSFTKYLLDLYNSFRKCVAMQRKLMKIQLAGSFFNP